MLLSNFGGVTNFNYLRYFLNKQLNFGNLTLWLWKKMTWGLTYFDQFRKMKTHQYTENQTKRNPTYTLNEPIATKVVCFSRLLKCLRNLYGKSVDPDQTVPIGAVCYGSTLLASILNSSVMLGNYLQQTISADDIFRCIFSWRFKG